MPFAAEKPKPRFDPFFGITPAKSQEQRAAAVKDRLRDHMAEFWRIRRHILVTNEAAKRADSLR